MFQNWRTIWLFKLHKWNTLNKIKFEIKDKEGLVSLDRIWAISNSSTLIFSFSYESSFFWIQNFKSRGTICKCHSISTKSDTNGISEIWKNPSGRSGEGEDTGVEITGQIIHILTQIPFAYQKERSFQPKVWELLFSRITALLINNNLLFILPFNNFLGTNTENNFPSNALSLKCTCMWVLRGSRRSMEWRTWEIANWIVWRVSLFVLIHHF